jgi:hypothetical protein
MESAVTEESKMWTTFRLQALRRELAELQKVTTPRDPASIAAWNAHQRAALATVIDAILDSLPDATD